MDHFIGGEEEKNNLYAQNNLYDPFTTPLISSIFKYNHLLL